MNKLNTNDHLQNAVSGSYNTEFVMKALCLIIWMVIFFTICSIIGLVMFIPKDNWNIKITP
jgi:ABC-type multidrug transport system permease subunit